MNEDIEEFYQQDDEYKELDHTALIAKLEDGSTLETIRNSEEWKLFTAAWQRIYDDAEKQLDNVDPSNNIRIIEAQLTKRFYKDVMGTLIRKIKEDAKAAFEQAQERGILSKISTFLKIK